jgi:hypothetical protein
MIEGCMWASTWGVYATCTHINANIVPGRPLTLMSNPQKLILISRKNLDINLKI